ncbi:MAG: protein-disulfide reductase DsbD [Devosia sp.]
MFKPKSALSISFLALLLVLVTGLSNSIAVAQTQQAPLPVDEAFAFTASEGAGGGTTLSWSIADGYYLYRDQISIDAADGTAATPPLPEGIDKNDPTFGVTEIYQGELALALTGDFEGDITVRYQGCQDKSICYPPVTKTLDAKTLQITSASSFPTLAAPQIDTVGATGAGNANLPIRLAQGGGGDMLSALAERGGASLVIASFLVFGVALAFTPCVFPMYPILAGSLTRASGRLTGRRAFALSLSYVLGMATAFSLLGVAAAWSGQNLQMALQSPWAIWSVAVLFVILAFSMFGLFELQLPSAWMTFVTRRSANGSGIGSNAALGFISALIVGPCVTAPLAAALVYIAQTGDVVLGAASLFALGLGKGIPLIIFGTVGTRMLPRAGAWMEHIKRIFGLVFLGAAIWMLDRVLPQPVIMGLWGILAFAGAIYLISGIALTTDRVIVRWAAGALGGLVILYSGMVAIGAGMGWSNPYAPLATLGANVPPGSEAEFVTTSSLDGLTALLRESGERPSLIYVTADWCISCDVIEREIWENPEAMQGLGGVTLVKADVSANDPQNQALMEALAVYGPPTMIFVDGSAAEVDGTRLIGEVDAATFRTAAAAAGML